MHVSNEFTIKALAETVLKMVGGKSMLFSKHMPQHDSKQRQPDVTVARETLCWEPRVNLEQCLEKTIAYFKNFLEL